MYLHKDDKELLRDIIVTVSERTGIDESIVEKDYYVTMILKELVQRNPNVVFKGGTSLSKAYHVIDRFSEDIDITFEEHLGEAAIEKKYYPQLKSVLTKQQMFNLPMAERKFGRELMKQHRNAKPKKRK